MRLQQTAEASASPMRYDAVSASTLLVACLALATLTLVSCSTARRCDIAVSASATYVTRGESVSVSVTGPACMTPGTYGLVWDSGRAGPHAKLEVPVVSGRGVGQFVIPADSILGEHVLSLSSQSAVHCDDGNKCAGPAGVLFIVSS